MNTFRIFLVSFLFVLAAGPYASYEFVRVNNANFEAAEQEALRTRGTTEGMYGDCSGMSIIIPVLAGGWCVLFFLWAFITLCIAGTVRREALLVQTLLIGTLGVLPALLWEAIAFLR